MSTAQHLTFTVPLSWEAHSLAQHYHSQQASTQKAKQVYLNTLAVYVVDHYLRCLGFKTDPAGSDSRNPIVLNFMDVADLSVPQLGKLECRPVLPDAQDLQIPSEAHEDRIGYVAVQFTQSLKKAEILGFTPNFLAQTPLTDLRSLAELPDYLHQIRQKLVVSQLSPFDTPTLVDLSNWFAGVTSTGWQTLDTLFGTHPQLVEVRGEKEISDGQVVKSQSSPSAIQRAKLIDLGLQLGDKTVMLVLTLTPNPDQTISALAQIHPASGSTCLPPQLQLKMLSESGEIMQEVWSRGQDNYIQLKRFSGKGGDRFRLQVALDDVSITENFVF